jgi:soluble lytic murein transglycosylase-like protein
MVVRADPKTGRLVRSVIVTSKSVPERTVPENVVSPRAVTSASDSPAPAPSGLDLAVDQIAAEHSLPPQLIHSVIRVESNYNPFAVSNKGAQGLMQLIPSTAKRFGVSDVFNPVQNIQGGAKYLRYLLDLYHGDYRLALAAYNAGEGAVQKFGGVPPYRETQNYINQVGKRLQQPAKAQPKPETKPVAVVSGGPHLQEIVEKDGSVRYVSR